MSELISGQFSGKVEHPPIRYIYDTEAREGYPKHYFIMRNSSNRLLGQLSMHDNGTISSIEVHPEVRRQGIATSLYNAAKQASQTNPDIPSPKHSYARTPSGEAWAKSIAKINKESLKPRELKVNPKDYNMRYGIWEMHLPLNQRNSLND